YVLEGYLYPKDKRYETKEAEEHDTQGRFHFHPEWAGYMGKAYRTQSFHVTGITMRKRATRPLIYPMGVHMYDCNNIDTTVREAAFYELCDRIQPGLIKDVNIPFPMTDWAGCILQVKKRLKTDDGWVRNFIAASMACSAGLRLCIAVDADVDIYSMDDIIWSLTTRVNPNQDLLKPVPGGAGQTFIPSERVTAGSAEWTGMNIRFEGGMGIDATVPYGLEKDFMRPVYPIDRVEPEQGDGARRRPPFVEGVPNVDGSCWWIPLDANKRSATISRGALATFLRGADVVVQGQVMTHYEDVARANPTAVLVTITPYGTTGPLAGAPASDLEITAASGSLWLAGEPGRAPVRSTLPQSPFWMGMYGAMGALVAL